jgi:hypothetical protein
MPSRTWKRRFGPRRPTALRELGARRLAAHVALFSVFSLGAACGQSGALSARVSDASAVGVLEAAPVRDGGPLGDAGGVDARADTGGVPADGAGPDVREGTSTDASSQGAPFDWVGIIGTGQSLSVGWDSTAISTTQPFKNVTLEDDGPDPKYPIDGAATANWSLVPLVEPVRQAVSLDAGGPGYGDSQYPDNIWVYNGSYGETPHSGMANTLSTLWAARKMGDYVTAHSVVGWSGHCLVDIDKEGGGRAYPASLSEARVFKKLADAAGKTYGVAGIILTHGECDATLGTTKYGDGLYQLWQDYNADLKAITGQSRDVVLLASQESSVAAGYDGSAVQLWQAGNAHPAQIVCTGPKYAYGYVGGLHMPAAGYERIGEKYAEVFDQVVNGGVAWKPLGPNRVARSGATITIDFDVPNPPLVWDANLTPPHQTVNTAWAHGQGFEVVDGANNQIAIASAAIQGSSVVLTLSQAPAPGTTLTVAYALTPDATGDQGGADAGMHGLLRDSDAFVGYSNETIAVTVTSGSAAIAGVMPNAFARRAARDIVSGAGVPSGTIASAVPDNDHITLSTAWPGPSGTAMLSFRHDHYNYAVHFATAVP